MTITIIIANSHTMYRQGLASLLDAENEFEILAEADNGRKAWELIKALEPDVAILDKSMPEMTGIEVATKTVNAGLSTYILLLTMHKDAYAALEAQEAGARGFILTCDTFQELVVAVRVLVAGGTFVSTSIKEKLRDLQRHGEAKKQMSKREREVMQLIALGKSSKEIGKIMDISPRTVDTYRMRLMNKLGLNSLADVVRYAIRLGLAS